MFEVGLHFTQEKDRCMQEQTTPFHSLLRAPQWPLMQMRHPQRERGERWRRFPRRKNEMGRCRKYPPSPSPSPTEKGRDQNLISDDEEGSERKTGAAIGGPTDGWKREAVIKFRYQIPGSVSSTRRAEVPSFAGMSAIDQRGRGRPRQRSFQNEFITCEH